MEGTSLLFIEFPYPIKQKVADCTQAHGARSLTDPSLHVNSFTMNLLLLLLLSLLLLLL